MVRDYEPQDDVIHVLHKLPLETIEPARANISLVIGGSPILFEFDN